MAKKKISAEEMNLPGTGVKVIDGQIGLALKVLKRKLKENGIIQEYKARQEYVKPSLKKRKQRLSAINIQKKSQKVE